MPVDPKMSIELRTKYGLVHVPNPSRCERWATAARAHLAAGEPQEHSGWMAAREVFPYEAREILRPDSMTVAELLELAR